MAFEVRELTVFLTGLTVEAEIGLHAHERGRGQPLSIDITIELDPAPVGSIRDTVNYEVLAEKTRALAKAGHVDLVETFAASLASACLSIPHVRAVRVRVEKPMAIEGARAAGVEIAVARNLPPSLRVSF